MICTSCGADNADASITCSQCGAPLGAPGEASPGVQPPAPPMPAPLAPIPPETTAPGTPPASPPSQPAQPAQIPSSSQRRGLIVGIVAAAVIVIGAGAAGAVVALGGSSSPGAVAQHAFNSLLSKDFGSFCKHVTPSEQHPCISYLSSPRARRKERFQVSGHTSVGETRIQGNEALVSFVGPLCIVFPAKSPIRKAVRHCLSNDPSRGMPRSAGRFQSAFSNAVHGSGQIQVMPLKRQNGRWYVYTGPFPNQPPYQVAQSGNCGCGSEGK